MVQVQKTNITAIIHGFMKKYKEALLIEHKV